MGKMASPILPLSVTRHADVAQLVERDLPKIDVASSILAVRSIAKGPSGSFRNGFVERWVRGSNRRTVNPLPARRPWFESRLLHHDFMSVSSSGPGQHSFTVNTRVRIPLPTPREHSQVARRQPSKLTTRVRFPLLAPVHVAPDIDSSPISFCGGSSVGRARPCQGRGRGLEARSPLQFCRDSSVGRAAD